MKQCTEEHRYESQTTVFRRNKRLLMRQKDYLYLVSLCLTSILLSVNYEAIPNVASLLVAPPLSLTLPIKPSAHPFLFFAARGGHERAP